MRDYQRARVYRAEDYLDRNTFFGFSNIRECREYVETVWSNPRIRARFPKACKTEKPLIKEGRSEHLSHAYYPPDEKITLSKPGQCDYTILHELSHIITEREYGKSGDWIKHGPQWVETHLFLVKTMLGNAFYENLIEALLMEGVQFTRP